MKITDLKCFVVGNPWKNWVLVKLDTDEGITGWGDATQGLATKPVVGAVQEFRRFCIGRDPLQIERLWEDMFTALYLTANGSYLSAMAGIETACWDVLGKSLGVPLHQLLGGKVRPAIKAYANGWYSGPRDVGSYAESAAQVVEMGYRALKFDPFGAAYRIMEPAERRLSLDLIKSVRNAVGDDVDIILEFHDRMTVPEAIRTVGEVAEFQPLWIEAPVWSIDVGAMISVAEATTLRITGGEQFTTLRQFADLFACGRFDLVLPEYVELGGIHRLRQAASIAEAYQGMIAPHNARCPLSTAVNVHVDVATRNALIQETFDDFYPPWMRELFQGLPRIVNGTLEVSDAPGIGVTINEALLGDHPYGENNFMNLFRSGWEQRFTR